VKNRAFTLLELLVVIAIIAILSVLALPAWNGIAGGQRLTSASQSLSDGLRLAQQLALAKSTPVEFRLYKVLPSDGGASNYCAYAFYQITDSGITNQLAKLTYFPKGTSLSTAANYSTLLTNGPGIDSLSRAYNSFKFRPDGSTDLPPSSRWYATLVRDREATNSTLPPNYITIQIDPLNGNVRFFRR
jgi:uncharacterized protein (TIGR02596 family)